MSALNKIKNSPEMLKDFLSKDLISVFPLTLPLNEACAAIEMPKLVLWVQV